MAQVPLWGAPTVPGGFFEGPLWSFEAPSRLAESGDFTVLELAAVSGYETLQMLKRYTHPQAENLARELG